MHSIFRTIRFYLALWAGKLLLYWYRRTGHTRNDRPGMASLRLYPDFLQQIATPKLTIVVTGTNGKTTISALLADLLQLDGKTVSYNDWGANHHAGVARCLLDAVSIWNKPTKDAAVIEMDELVSPLDVPYLHPNYLVVSNLARDSMLRNAHPEHIYRQLEKTVSLTPGAVLLLNADDPISSRLGAGQRTITFGVCNQHTDQTVHAVNDFSVCPNCGGIPQYHYRNYRHIGDFYCPKCGLHARSRDYFVEEADFSTGVLTLREPSGDARYPMVSHSLHNLYNQAAVTALLRDLGLDARTLARYLEQVHILPSRESEQTVGGIRLKTHIAKGQNPTAASTVFEYLSRIPTKKELVLLLDEVYDTPLKTETIAWIYDTDYEYLNRPEIQKIVVAGARYLDHRLRLLLAGVPAEKLVCVRQESDAAQYVDLTGIEEIYVLHDVNAISRGRQVRDQIKARILQEGGNPS